MVFSNVVGKLQLLLGEFNAAERMQSKDFYHTRILRFSNSFKAVDCFSFGPVISYSILKGLKSPKMIYVLKMYG